MKRFILCFFSLMLLGVSLVAQEYFRSGIFLHHSTGQYIWGPNPDGTSTTTIPEQMEQFNLVHNLNGNEAVSLVEEWWVPGDNEWSTQHAFFEGLLSSSNFYGYLANNKILVVKSCFPSSALEAWGQASDTTDPTYKTIMNYKWHWHHILDVMKNHPENFFVIWTNAPLEPTSTYPEQALLAKAFCSWAKDTLAAGLDPVFGEFPPNVYVFDYFSKLTGNNGMELSQYVTGPGDSHPNGAATDFVAPQFVEEIFSAALAYEQVYNAIPEHPVNISMDCHPNPTNGTITLQVFGQQPSQARLYIFNTEGLVVQENTLTISFGKTSIPIDVSALPSGLYLVRLVMDQQSTNTRLIKM